RPSPLRHALHLPSWPPDPHRNQLPRTRKKIRPPTIVVAAEVTRLIHVRRARRIRCVSRNFDNRRRNSVSLTVSMPNGFCNVSKSRSRLTTYSALQARAHSTNLLSVGS